MDINQLAIGTAPSDGFKKHPVGEFPAFIKSVTQKMVNDRKIWEVVLGTDHGECTHTIWGFNQSDIQRMYTDPDFKNTIANSIARVKRMFVDVGIGSPEEITRVGWDSGHINCISLLPNLIGKRCTAVVQDSTKKPGQQLVYINAPQVNPTKFEMSQSQHQTNTQSFNTIPPSFAKQPPATPDLDNIPF